MVDMCPILPPTGRVFSSIHLESGLAFVICLSNRICQKWHPGTFRARAWEILLLLSSLFGHSFFECSPMEYSFWGPSCRAVRSPSQMERPNWVPSQLPASTTSHIKRNNTPVAVPEELHLRNLNHTWTWIRYQDSGHQADAIIRWDFWRS